MEAVALLAPVVDYLIKPVVRQVGYLIHYKSNVENLDAQTKDLVRAKERLQHDVDEELRKVGQETEGDVKDWLTKTDEIIAEARQFLEDERQAKKCLYGFCRYRPSRKATKVSQKIDVELQKRKEFQRLTYGTPLQNIWPKVGHVALESRTSIVTQILEELKKDDMNMIGVFGMAGVGKSTFVKQVANQVREEKIFDIVGEAEVKQNPDVESIQNELFLSFGLQLDKSQTIIERKRSLRDYTKDKKRKILIILDDIWEWLDLNTLGLEEGYCKILLTSRDGVMLHSKMGTQKNFQLKVLDQEETWSLFEKKVGDAVKRPDIREIATKLANRCGGLPILVETIAKTLRGKPIHSWNDALASLSRSDGKGLLEKVYLGIEWSYNQLDDEDVKSLFLISGMIWDQNFHLCC